jgi:hypothetical protein
VDIHGYGTQGIWTCSIIWLRIWWYNGYAGIDRYMWLTIYMWTCRNVLLRIPKLAH